MSISSLTSKVIYVGTGSTASTVFAYPFTIHADADLTVTEYSLANSTSAVKTLDSDYVVSGAGVSGGGNVTLTGSYTSVPSGSNLIIQREMDITQATDYVENDPFSAATHETALDKSCMIDQQLQEQIDRCIKADINQTSANFTYTDFASQNAVSVSCATGAVAQATICVSSGTAATSLATVAVSAATGAVTEAASAASSGTACVSLGTVSVSSATACVSFGPLCVSSGTACVSLGTVSVSSATGAVSEATVAASSATAAVSAAASNYRYFRATLIDPYEIYDISPTICLLESLNAAITVNNLIMSCDIDPHVQLSGNLKYADAFIGTANPIGINPFNTTSGVRNDFSISNASVAAGKCMYLAFDAQPSEGITSINVNIKYTYD